jgi:hypothetical protein
MIIFSKNEEKWEMRRVSQNQRFGIFDSSSDCFQAPASLFIFRITDRDILVGELEMPF